MKKTTQAHKGCCLLMIDSRTNQNEGEQHIPRPDVRFRSLSVQNDGEAAGCADLPKRVVR